MLSTAVRLLSRGKLTVLLFHKVPSVRSLYTPNEIDLAGFERVLTTAAKIFHIIPLEVAVLALRAGNLPERAACITFDDGYADWLNGVVPVLEQHKAHATFFITTGQFFNVPMWNERILHAISNAPASKSTLMLPQSGLPELATGQLAERTHAIATLEQHLKYLPLQQREAQLQALESWSGTSHADVPTMPLADLRAIHNKGFGIGSHTVKHPILTRCTPADALQEMVDSREQLESFIGGKVTAFAYPNGAPNKDFGPEHIEIAKRAGYTCALTTHWGVATGDTSIFQIPRFTPWGPTKTRMELQMARNLRLQPMALSELEPEPPQKKVLMVAFHFPPQSGSSGILRSLNFVKNLPNNGWAPTVLTASASVYEEQRNDLISAIPPRTRILRAFALDAAKDLSIGNKYPQVFALPDRWASWWVHAVVLGLREIRHQRTQLIWSTYPFTTAHMIGGTLARMSGLPWVADFRDPMVNPAYPANKLQRAVWQWLEAYTLKAAAACVFTTQRAASTYGERYPAAAHKCVVIENGYDEEAFACVLPDRYGTPVDTLLLLHSGLIYPQDRNPSTFFEAVSALIAQGKLDRSKLCIRFRSPHHGDEVRAFAEKYGLAGLVDIAPPIPYREAIAEMMGADLLLVFQGSYFNAQIPAKIYEYLRSARPILAIVDPLGNTAGQLDKFKAVHVADIASSDMIKTALLSALSQINTPAQLLVLAQNSALVQPYSRSAQATTLAHLLDSVSL